MILAVYVIKALNKIQYSSINLQLNHMEINEGLKKNGEQASYLTIKIKRCIFR